MAFVAAIFFDFQRKKKLSVCFSEIQIEEERLTKKKVFLLTGSLNLSYYSSVSTPHSHGHRASNKRFTTLGLLSLIPFLFTLINVAPQNNNPLHSDCIYSQLL